MSERFCHYCRRHHADEGFRLVPDPTGKTKRAMCGPCQQARKQARKAPEKRVEEQS